MREMKVKSLIAIAKIGSLHLTHSMRNESVCLTVHGTRSQIVTSHVMREKRKRQINRKMILPDNNSRTSREMRKINQEKERSES